ncbi:TPA: methyl-accepting chemotaxis protein [Aeromonas salmonicida]|uniref:Methyl-accepting chemotaxis protein n=4 Tax=Aeromonas salmonicida TaxID=645 RepID=A4SST6_AERS4|nr:methyl-accepting chemotaxis protein [Aeromonas salmonicida]ABO91958.1 methyl-accepting chemotaxis protein [Aeromonas salmonicida subsp. salmonicida A449]AYO64921.1 methyl-accepting chemotaxis protein [Aeromonas salmonicida subsp. salmonicida 01-B526]EKP0238881.1 methyl-accepting chemotaxis protein [Aeromonas salmonicida]EKP0243065.1 methyl-accepting chemotaxis protein [Aeromonas salmonicida]EKP0251448.1 methyl-accepting chemotaxis protein [Aeromonas salmonicida]
MGWSLGTIKGRYTAVFVGFMVLVCALTVIGIQIWIKPALQKAGEQNVTLLVSEIATDILDELNGVQSQSRSITQLVAQLPSEQIDALLPALIDQYGNAMVFGGGIWPLPDQREAGRAKFSTFFHRDAANKLIPNTYWNSAEAPNYFEQPWHKAGQQAPQGMCVWAAAYKDGASQQPRTNCAMGIYRNGALFGVSTIDVTLGFFNDLVARKEQEIGGQVMIIEADGKILSKNARLNGDVVLGNLSAHADYPFAGAIASLIGQSRGTGLLRTTFQDQGQEQTLLLQAIEGTPWLLATALPTSTLTQDSQDVLTTLAAIQLPLVGLLFVLMLLAITQLGSRLQTLKQNIDALSTGDADLTARIQVKGNDELDHIALSVNRFIAYLQQMMVQVTDATDLITRELAQLDQQTGQARRILGEHAAETDQVVTALTELSSTADSVAQHASDSASFTEAANGQAANSRKVVGSASASVVALIDDVDLAAAKVLEMQEDAKQIGSVLGVIGGIAAQTNLLALNAAIEAARAGEQGRGFAVVADEVRALAARTQKSTAEVGSMLSRLTQGVADAVVAMEQTKRSCQAAADTTGQVTGGLDSMADSVVQIHDLSSQIATAAEEQSRVTEEINRNMVSIRDMLNLLVENGRNTEQSAESLLSSNRQLLALVRRFKV